MSIPKANLNKPTDALVNLMDKLNNFTDGEKENELNLPNCKYRYTDYFKNLSKDIKRKALSFFRMFAHVLRILMISTYYLVS